MTQGGRGGLGGFGRGTAPAGGSNPGAGALGITVNASGTGQLQQIRDLLQQIQALSKINVQIGTPPGGVPGALGAAPGAAPSGASPAGAALGAAAGGAPSGSPPGFAPSTAPALPARLPAPESMLSSRTITAGGGVFSQAMQTAGQGAYDPGAGARLFGQGVQGAFSAVGRGITNLGAAGGLPMLGPVGAFAGAFGAGVGTFADLMGQGIGLRLENLRRIGGLERFDIQSRSMGGPGAGFASAGVAAGARFGFAPEEAAGTLASFRRQIGATGEAPLPFASILSGLDPGALAQYLGQRAPGFGGAGDTNTQLANLIGTAQDGGLRGSKVDQYLSRLVALNQQMAERGIKIDLGDQAGFLEALRLRGIEGMRGVQVSESIQGTARSGLDRMSAPLFQIAETLQVAHAFAGAGSFEEGLGNLGEQAANPNKALAALGQDPRLRRLLLAGIAGPDALGLADVRGPLSAQAAPSMGLAQGGGRISSTLARQDIERMRVAYGGGGADVEKFLGATNQAQLSLINAATGPTAEMLVGLGNSLLDGMTRLVKALENTAAAAEKSEAKRIYAPALEDDRIPSPFDIRTSGPKL